MAAHGERILNLGPRPLASPRLSVLTPFHRDDPSALIERLGRAPEGVEFVFLDDGSGSAALLARVLKCAEALHAPVKIVVLKDNSGRAAARNRLIEEARGEYVLFLDADMAPDASDFLPRWLELIQQQRPFVAFGGLSLKHTAITPETALHHDLFGRSDCRTAHERARYPAQFTASANLLVRRDLMREIQFDPGFHGWGWEDVDWALRAAKCAPILHVDNSASHTGLEDIDTLLRKCAEAGPNFARLARKHPQAMAKMASYRVARALKLAPLRSSWRAFCAWLARDPMQTAPLRVRSAALKLYRASYYAEYLP
ncbi:MAG: glycosyltransferase family 2 protein [Hyphomonadaceae bacterium]